MTTDFPYPQIGALVRNRRKSLRLTQDELANEVGISRASMANIEAGRQRILVGQIYSLANALKLAVPELLPSADIQKSQVSTPDFAPPIKEDRNLPPSYVEAAKRVMGGSS